LSTSQSCCVSEGGSKMSHREAQALEALAQALARKVQAKTSPNKRLCVIEQPAAPAAVNFDHITRHAVTTRIRRLRDHWHLELLVEQAVFGRAGLCDLNDGELACLLSDLERARQCLNDDIAFEDAGLVQDVSNRIPV